MNSPLLNSIGLGSLDIAYVLIALIVCIIILLVLLIVEFNKINLLTKRYNEFMAGANGRSLEKKLGELLDNQAMINSLLEKNNKEIRELFKRNKNNFQKIGLVKYDAFNAMGGNMSFALALLDENNNGFVINSVHSTTGCFVYNKRIIGGQCKASLGPEEQRAINKAMGIKAKKESEDEGND